MTPCCRKHIFWARLTVLTLLGFCQLMMVKQIKMMGGSWKPTKIGLQQDPINQFKKLSADTINQLQLDVFWNASSFDLNADCQWTLKPVSGTHLS